MDILTSREVFRQVVESRAFVGATLHPRRMGEER